MRTLNTPHTTYIRAHALMHTRTRNTSTRTHQHAQADTHVCARVLTNAFCYIQDVTNARANGSHAAAAREAEHHFPAARAQQGDAHRRSPSRHTRTRTRPHSLNTIVCWRRQQHAASICSACTSRGAHHSFNINTARSTAEVKQLFRAITVYIIFLIINIIDFTKLHAHIFLVNQTGVLDW